MCLLPIGSRRVFPLIFETGVSKQDSFGGRPGFAGRRHPFPDEPSEDALRRLTGLPDVSLVTYREASGRADVVHRPFQLSNAGDLGFLRTLGDRLILTQQDLIDYRIAFLTKGECPPSGLKPHADILREFPYIGTPHQK